MMNVALSERNVYENFEVETDILYFNVGRLGLVSFHGRNYNIKKSMSADQLNAYIADGRFVKVNANCYVNSGKIMSLTDGIIQFQGCGSDDKQVPVSKWRQHQIKNLLAARKPMAM
ncbi:LytTR family transcriptional regulator DNA-binding domain-containing protein [Paenibacillus sepulcri]|uniref:LytTR family transcriptional regulator DNA-binding domain-containing protein n=1 Tax=Paenibacillus sepulcri TaxID=359917 RepID=A0ABS7BZZ3_9BACL|nr:LytTR family transcriptional regulator DNA-binding domain-containing protein [Paenibacillus sepulcri]